MNLNQLKSKTKRKSAKRVGRGGKRGTTSGKGTKGQKSRAGAGFKQGFRGGDNRLWQLFPKLRGATKKHGSKRPHAKHRYFQLRHDKIKVFNLDFFNKFEDGQKINPELLTKKEVKVLSEGSLKKRLEFSGFKFSKSAREKILKSGSTINE
ncbi:MAG: 50S ribosomal protein L15 [Candidatus Yanofskybacteria bacterium GW2011_GWA1_39_13]|uniref:Large ribosomal subunit protein uL15 n=1 Tax=Yanofskybacteria sp. (strain GW2011_GWA1_39_13) TaxID=1619019 RepID=A0A0G0MGQ0_YANXG|nr:MAG: 50S ribosomal protein L15 [Candidatus Yanofskybacteria bacterium GW2011_GWA1_39_13]